MKPKGLGSHEISQADAEAMTARYRQQRPNNYFICETFDAEAIRLLLDQDSACSLRIYLGMREDEEVVAILVAADKQGKDIVVYPPETQNSSTQNGPHEGHGGHGGPGHGGPGNGGPGNGGPGHGNPPGTRDSGIILEDGDRCPIKCPPPSPLNTGM